MQTVGERAIGWGAHAAGIAVAVWLPLAVLSLAASGCSLVRDAAAVPQKTVSALVSNGSPRPIDPATLQQRLMHYGDQAIQRLVAALDDYARRDGTAAISERTLRVKLDFVGALIGIVTGPNPNTGLIDLLSTVTLARAAFEAYAAGDPEPERTAPLVEMARGLEEAAWVIAREVLQPVQVEELKSAIDAWVSRYDQPLLTGFARPQEDTADLRSELAAKPERFGSLFSFLTLDPITGLDPAVREVTASRLFAERAMFAVQRMPMQLRWQVELMTLRMLALAEVQAVVESSTRFSQSAERLSYTAETLPEELAAELRESLAATEEASASLNTALKTFDALMARFGVGEPKEGRPPPDPNARRFDILDYARTAEAITATAKELDAVLEELNGTLDSPALEARLSKVKEVSALAAADARGVLNHAALLAGGLIVFLFACAYAYRVLVRKRGS